MCWPWSTSSLGVFSLSLGRRELGPVDAPSLLLLLLRVVGVNLCDCFEQFDRVQVTSSIR